MKNESKKVSRYILGLILIGGFVLIIAYAIQMNDINHDWKKGFNAFSQEMTDYVYGRKKLPYPNNSLRVSNI